MSKVGFISKSYKYDLSIYAKWLCYLGKQDDEIDMILRDFCEKYKETFNYDTEFKLIDDAIGSTKKYKLRIPCSIVITQNEWDSIVSIEDDRYRRYLFIVLVFAKFFKSNDIRIDAEVRVSDKYYCFESETDIFKLANIKIKTKADKNIMFSCLGNAGLITLTCDRKNMKSYAYKQVNYVDNDSVPIIHIEDYNNIILYYENLMGEKIGVCKECGMLFRQNKKNNAEYCFQHRSYKKLESKIIRCIDCGVEVEVNSKNNKKKRCDSCQKKYIREYDKIRKKK